MGSLHLETAYCCDVFDGRLRRGLVSAERRLFLVLRSRCQTAPGINLTRGKGRSPRNNSLLHAVSQTLASGIKEAPRHSFPNSTFSSSDSAPTENHGLISLLNTTKTIGPGVSVDNDTSCTTKHRGCELPNLRLSGINGGYKYQFPAHSMNEVGD
ncbi:hypothetical protein RRG08_029870 [Elysia crispata]|uniref:Uncharacterized protein n=1 Tax=Elysia crispata TaxID=231223 RepID=A0AAE1D0I4_9GAST|nr:hypothetical protein RRG08_029870 [Elysia crispata]